MRSPRSRCRRRQGARASASLLASLSPLLLLVAALVAAAVTPVHAAVSNVVTQWTEATKPTIRMMSLPNFLVTRTFGLIGLASHKAIEVNPSLDPSQAAALASHAVVSALFPWQQSAVFDGLLRQQLTAGSNATTKPPPPRVRDSIRDLATALVAKTTPSNAWVDFNFAPSGTLWAYQKSMPMQNFTFMPQLGQSTPVVSPAARLDAIVANTDSRRGRVFRPPTTPARTVDYETTYRLGSANSTERDAYDTASASFWAAGANTTAIGGMWLDIALQALPESTTVAETALFLARAFGAAYDAGIAAYKLKYSVLQWRPISAFRVGYPKQGPIPAFAPDPAWTPLLMTPPHPDYPSGHSSTVGAVLEVLLRTLGLKNDGTKWDSIATTARSESNPQAGERSYPSLTAAATEVGDSRVYAGVHFNHSCADALALGRLVGGEAFEALKPAAGGLLSPRRIFGR